MLPKGSQQRWYVALRLTKTFQLRVRPARGKRHAPSTLVVLLLGSKWHAATHDICQFCQRIPIRCLCWSRVLMSMLWMYPYYVCHYIHTCIPCTPYLHPYHLQFTLYCQISSYLCGRRNLICCASFKLHSQWTIHWSIIAAVWQSRLCQTRRGLEACWADNPSSFIPWTVTDSANIYSFCCTRVITKMDFRLTKATPVIAEPLYPCSPL